MKELHWSKIYINFITIEITYSDGARQGWDYDCSQFATIEDMKLNMTADFENPRADWASIMIHITRNGESYSGEIGVTNLTGGDFVIEVFKNIEDMFTWQPAEIS